MLEFSATPLGDALELFNQHARDSGGVRLVLANSALERLQLSGMVRANNVDTLLLLLARDFGIRADRGEGVIVLRR
jgi:ferric-dicitrate binding protein FerR (iron transport regulator)